MGMGMAGPWAPFISGLGDKTIAQLLQDLEREMQRVNAGALSLHHFLLSHSTHELVLHPCFVIKLHSGSRRRPAHHRLLEVIQELQQQLSPGTQDMCLCRDW